jgi:hypothetical protein
VIVRSFPYTVKDSFTVNKMLFELNSGASLTARRCADRFEAPDAETAIKTAIRKYDITDPRSAQSRRRAADCDGRLMAGNVARFPLDAPINAGKLWSDMDDFDLLDFDAQGISTEETAEFLCREESEVVARLEALKPKAN